MISFVLLLTFRELKNRLNLLSYYVSPLICPLFITHILLLITLTMMKRYGESVA